ncbi:MAG: hypothetical protein WAO19_00645 [Candidatus Kryptoniota bacterium]
MKLSIQIEPKETYLYVLVTGTFELSEAMDLTVRVLDACVEHSLFKILVDQRSLQGEMSVMDRWRYATFMARHIIERISKGTFPYCRVAYVGNAPIIDPGGFAEMVMANRGIIAKATLDINEGLRWLGVESTTMQPLSNGE